MIRILSTVLNNAVNPIILVMSMWVTFLFNLNYNWHLEQFGLQPHQIDGLWGILTMPLLHENFEHLFSNTIPILIAGSFLFYYFKQLTWLITAVIWISSAIILWFIGEEGTNHIGASGLVYGLVFFLLVSGIIRGHRHLAAVALLMVFLYGSLIWGLFPDYVKLMKENISWEGHLGGALSGTIMAILLVKMGPEKPLDHTTEDPEEDEYEVPYWMVDIENNEIENQNTLNEPNPIPEKEDNEINPKININHEQTFNYRYVPKNANAWEKDD